MSNPIVPPVNGLTSEAMEALGIEEVPIPLPGISSDDTGDNPVDGFQSMGGDPFPDGDTIDLQADPDNLPPAGPPAKSRSRQRSKPEEKTESRAPKSGPPSLDEWANFFSRVVLRVTTEYYISYAFRGIDEDALTEREVERLAMTDEERDLIATPFAELSNKSKFMRKHGRMIVASGDAFNALVVLGAWASRVNRIAAKYRPRQAKAKVTLNGHTGPGSQSTVFAEGTTGGRIPNGYDGPIFPGTG
jgi:hypothetical protein